MSIASFSRFATPLRESYQSKLHRLGANVGVNYCRWDHEHDGVQEVQALFISCPREDWIAEFGEPHDVRNYFDPLVGQWFQQWQHELDNGVVRCVGDFFRRSSGRQWIIVRQLSAVEADEE